MPIPLISDIAPKNNGTFPTHSSQFGKGGWHEVAIQADMLAIPSARRAAGMACRVVAQNLTYILQPDLITWTPDSSSGIPDAPDDGIGYVRKDGDWSDTVDEGEFT